MIKTAINLSSLLTKHTYIIPLVLPFIYFSYAFIREDFSSSAVSSAKALIFTTEENSTPTYLLIIVTFQASPGEISIKHFSPPTMRVPLEIKNIVEIFNKSEAVIQGEPIEIFTIKTRDLGVFENLQNKFVTIAKEFSHFSGFKVAISEFLLFLEEEGLHILYETFHISFVYNRGQNNINICSINFDSAQYIALVREIKLRLVLSLIVIEGNVTEKNPTCGLKFERLNLIFELANSSLSAGKDVLISWKSKPKIKYFVEEFRKYSVELEIVEKEEGSWYKDVWVLSGALFVGIAIILVFGACYLTWEIKNKKRRFIERTESDATQD